jgi:hypothetical protein
MIKWIIILFLFLVACGTPESKILNSFNEGRITRHIKGGFEIKSVAIYDTIYTKDVDNSLQKVQTQLLNIEKLPRKVEKFNNKHYDDYGDLLRRQGDMYLLYQDIINDSICGYYARIITNKDTFDFVVTTKYKILCPVFVYNDESLTKF